MNMRELLNAFHLMDVPERYSCLKNHQICVISPIIKLLFLQVDQKQNYFPDIADLLIGVRINVYSAFLGLPDFEAYCERLQ